MKIRIILLSILLLVGSNVASRAQVLTLVGQYSINYRTNAAGCRPPTWPAYSETDGNPYACRNSLGSPHSINAAPGRYRVVIESTNRSGSERVWSGDASHGRQYSLEQIPTTGCLDFVHTNGQIVLYAWDWIPSDNPIDWHVEVSLYRIDTTLSVRVSQVEVCWPSCSNRVYQVQYKASIDSGDWTSLGTPITGDGGTKCAMDAVRENEKRFYRVVEQP